MKVKYVGEMVSVQIAATGQEAERGKTIEVDDAVGRQLIKQDTWEKVTTKKENNDG